MQLYLYHFYPKEIFISILFLLLSQCFCQGQSLQELNLKSKIQHISSQKQLLESGIREQQDQLSALRSFGGKEELEARLENNIKTAMASLEEAESLLAQAQSEYSSLLGQGGEMVSGVQKLESPSIMEDASEKLDSKVRQTEKLLSSERTAAHSGRAELLSFQEPRSFREHLFTESDFAFGAIDGRLSSVSPLVGYQIGSQAEIGLGGIWSVAEGGFQGARLMGRYYIFKNIFALQLENIGSLPFSQPDQKFLESSSQLIGGRLSLPLQEARNYLSITLLSSLKDGGGRASTIAEPWQVKMGLSF